MKIHFALLALFIAGPVSADSPPRPPERHTVCSPTGRVCATSDPSTNTTLVSSQSASDEAWSLPGWHRWIFVSDDGESVVTGYQGMNLVPLDISLDEPVLFFYNKGSLVHTVLLGDLYEHKSQLTPTASHYAWAYIPGINQSNQLVVELETGKKVAFSASTGQLQRLIPDGT